MEKLRKSPTLKREDALIRFTTKLLSPDKQEYIMPEALEILRKAAGADRAYIFDVVTGDDGEPAWHSLYETCAPDIEPQINNPEMQKIPFGWFPFWITEHMKGNPINGPIRNLPELERTMLEKQQVLSLLCLPFLKNERYNGFIGFDDCHTEREWSAADITMLKTASDAVQMYFEKQTLEDQLWEKTEELEGFFNVALDLLCIADFNGRFVRVNQAWEMILGYSTSDLEGRSFLEFIHPDDRQATVQIVGDLMSGKPALGFVNRYLASDNSYRYIEWRSLPFRNRIYAAARDITEHKQYEEKLLQLSVTDALTGIHNRRYFTKRLEEEIYRSQRFHSVFSLLMFDIDHFKLINDRYGHRIGDDVLTYLTKLMKTRLRKTDIFARWGGEEFMILLVNTPAADGFSYAEELREMVETSEFDTVGGITVSIGVTAYIDLDTADTLIQRVDSFMYKAKNSGRNVTVSDDNAGLYN